MSSGLKEDILRFIAQNPEACDTVEGISTFWVPGACKSKIITALDELVADGRLRRVEVGQRQHYCLGSRQ